MTLAKLAGINPPPTDIHAGGITIRPLDGADRSAVKRLAQLDSERAPAEPLLGAEIEGRLLAAISLETGESIADPFSRSAELRALLELRAAQLRRRDRTRRRPQRLPRRRPRVALAGSPPGAPSWLISQRPRPF
jgi:hypothetical protein